MSNFDWSDSTLSGVKGSDLNLVRTSPHINRWESDGNGSLIIKAREDSDTYSRSTTHFTLNSTVQDHSSGTFSGGKYAVISPLSTAADNNIVSGIGTVDTWMLPTEGKITLPGATLFAPEGEELPERLKGVNTIRYTPDDDITKNYANLSSAIDTELKQKGVPTFDVGAYGWQGVSQPTKEEISNISSLVGSSIDLPSIHFGSPDETMESLISDVLKLKQYTIKDDFDSSEKSPMQQLDELKGRLSDEVSGVHEKAKGMYQEKFNKAYDSTKLEVDKWLDIKYPETVEHPISSKSIPPPLPSNMPIDTPLDMLGKSSEWFSSKPKLPPAQQLLRDIADLQKEVQPDHHSVDGILKEGLFGGTNSKLNVNESGNVVLTRMANSEAHLTKNWVYSDPMDMLNTSLSHGGGSGLPTSGISSWSDSFNSKAEIHSKFEIPSKDLLQAIRDKNAIVGNIGEGEIVLNPQWAKDYLKTVNGKDVVVNKSGGVVYNDSKKSIDDIRSTTTSSNGLPSSITLGEDLTTKPKPTVSKTTDQGIDRNKQSGVDPKKTVQQQHTDVHKKVEENSIKNFFGGNRLASFDTETTGLDHKNKNLSKRDRIWQVGLAIDGVGGVEEHTNPFFRSTVDNKIERGSKLSDPYLESSLKNSNGRFSKIAFEKGNFNNFMSLYKEDKLVNLETSLKNTLGSLNPSDVVVLQNMNFENQMLKSSLDQGLISKDFYQTISDRMLTTSIDREKNSLTLFQRPAKVQQLMRKADMTYHTEYLNDLSEDSFQKYRETVNKAISEYSTIINDTKRTGVVAVELQDLTKAFLANGANSGLIDKKTSTLGLNIDFLSKAILGTSESHTALKDSEDTISLFKKMWQMNSELNSGLEVSKETLGVFNNIKKQQPEEINKRFISSVRSVVNDFKEKNYSNISNKLTWFNPEVMLKNKTSTGFNITKLDQIALTPKKREYDFSKALGNTLSRYNMFEDNIGGFNRSTFIDSVVDESKQGTSFNKIHERVDNEYFNYKHAEGTSESIIPKEVSNNLKSNFWEEKTSLFGKEMKVKTKATLLGGLAAGLGYMAMSPKPSEKQEKDYSNVSEQFYDEQYLGTAFVDFNERNKHYMM